jgi:hypothetical protein
MVEWLESLPTAGAGVVVVGGFVLLTLITGYAIGKVAPREVRIEHNDLAGFILAVIGVVYAVLLAFVAIGVWERFQGAEEHSFDEAGALTVLYRDVGVFPQRVKVREDLHRYVSTVIDDEWPKMRRGAESEEADLLIEHVNNDVLNLSVSSPRLQNVQMQLIQSVDRALEDRDIRLSAQATGINGLMWSVLLLGAVLTVGFTYLFGFRHTVMQQLMIGSLGCLIGLVLFLAVALDYPFRGSIAVQPEAFHTALETFHTIGP